MNKDSIVLVGNFVEIQELVQRLELTVDAVVDSNTSKLKGSGIINFASDQEFLNQDIVSTVFISPDSPKVREKLFLEYESKGHSVTSLICPLATVSVSATIGVGSCIQSNAHISSKVKLGKGAKVNSCANIMHDSTIGDFTSIAPNAVILGGVQVGKKCYIGANSTILPNIKIGDESVVGAGSVVTKNVPPYSTVYGNPARIKQ